MISPTDIRGEVLDADQLEAIEVAAVGRLWIDLERNATTDRLCRKGIIRAKGPRFVLSEFGRELLRRGEAQQQRRFA